MTIAPNPTTDRNRAASAAALPRADLGLEVERRLRASGHLALLDVSSEVQAGIVRLRGCVPTYYLKQEAQAIVSEIEGVRLVQNQMDIGVPSGRPPLGHEEEESRDTNGAIAIVRRPLRSKDRVPPRSRKGVGNDAGTEPQVERDDHHQ